MNNNINPLFILLSDPPLDAARLKDEALVWLTYLFNFRLRTKESLIQFMSFYGLDDLDIPELKTEEKLSIEEVDGIKTKYSIDPNNVLLRRFSIRPKNRNDMVEFLALILLLIESTEFNGRYLHVTEQARVRAYHVLQNNGMAYIKQHDWYNPEYFARISIEIFYTISYISKSELTDGIPDKNQKLLELRDLYRAFPTKNIMEPSDEPGDDIIGKLHTLGVKVHAYAKELFEYLIQKDQ
jgi:hypothetical protein